MNQVKRGSVEELIEAAISGWYAWETRKLSHPDHPETLQAWQKRMETAHDRIYDALSHMGVIDDRLRP